MAHPLSRRIADVLDLAPEAPAVEYDGAWYTWAQLGETARAVAAVTEPGGRIGILLRNRPTHAAAVLGVLLSEGCVVVINPSRGDERTRADIAALGLPAIIGAPADLAGLVTTDTSTTVVTLTDLTGPPQIARAAAPSPDRSRWG